MSDIVLDNVRDKILDLVIDINTYDPLEKQHINDTVAWINSDEQIFRISSAYVLHGNPDKAVRLCLSLDLNCHHVRALWHVMRILLLLFLKINFNR